jgi:hypothetical protein
MRGFLSAVLAAALGGVGLSATHALADPALSSTQLQAIQQKTYRAEKSVVFASVMDVLQDLGFSVASADIASGFITAESANASKTTFWDVLSNVEGSGNTKATVFLEPAPGGGTRVRLNFVATKTSSSNLGQAAREDHQITAVAPYERMFARIDAAVLSRAPGAVAAGSTPAPIGPLGPGVSVASAIPAAELLAAAKHELEAEGFQAIAFDPGAGTLVTAPMGLHLTPAEADCGKVLGFPYLGDKRATTDGQYFVDASGGKIRARLAVDGTWHAGYGGPDKPLSCSSTGAEEAAFLAKVTHP